MRILFLFFDGVGLGADDPSVNPFARAVMPAIQSLLDGRRLIAPSAPWTGERATLLALDAGLGVAGLPQSATGQAVLLTGINIPAEIGEHYGPKPSPAVAKYLRGGGLFAELSGHGKSVTLLNAYPPRYFHAIRSGRRLHSSIPLAATSAGIRLFGADDLLAGRALSADLTGEAWVKMLGYPHAPVYSPAEAGRLMGSLAANYDFCLFEYWATDYAGHKQDMTWALQQLQLLDDAIAGLLQIVDEGQLVLITSDHGNMEDLSTRRHTSAAVPALVIGEQRARKRFCEDLHDLGDVAPAIRRSLGVAA